MNNALLREPFPVGGIVLCGGQSRRMGRAKAWLPFGPETMLQRVTRIVARTVQPVAVVAGRGQEIPELPAGVLVARDSVNGRGPLQGLADGISCLGQRVQAAFLTSCDLPFLRVEFIVRMIARLADCEIAVPKAQGLCHPLAAVYRSSVLPTAHELLAGGVSRLGSLLEKCQTRVILEDELLTVDPGLRSLWNINSPEEYEAALKEAAN
jgi:molybdenum cofactor guanylyltransferase